MKHLLFLGIVFAAFQVSHSEPPAFCNLPSDAGEGGSFLFALYYDAADDVCRPFLYNGQGGNANRFQNERECLRNCSSQAEKIYPMDAREACHFKKLEGKCSGNYLRYYYDPVHEKCKKFFWSGCMGNGNRFFSYESCNTTCAGIHDEGDDLEEDEPDTPIAIICGVLLGVVVVAILITTIVLCVNSNKKKTGRKSRDPKSEAPLREQGIEMA